MIDEAISRYVNNFIRYSERCTFILYKFIYQQRINVMQIFYSTNKFNNAWNRNIDLDIGMVDFNNKIGK